jgi:DNA-binding transcriptional regulator/RsmH inhibitor MraZ
MPRAKWLNKLESKEDLGIPTRFKERYTKSCYEVVIIRYFLTDEPYILI